MSPAGPAGRKVPAPGPPPKPAGSAPSSPAAGSAEALACRLRRSGNAWSRPAWPTVVLPSAADSLGDILESGSRQPGRARRRCAADEAGLRLAHHLADDAAALPPIAFSVPNSRTRRDTAAIVNRLAGRNAAMTTASARRLPRLLARLEALDSEPVTSLARSLEVVAVSRASPWRSRRRRC